MGDYPNIEAAKGNTDHVICDGKKDGIFECRHCGASEQPGFPMDMKVLLKTIDHFIGKHKDCQDQKATKKLTFKGYGDDIVNVHTCEISAKKVDGHAEEYGCYQPSDDIVMCQFKIGGKMKVYGIYDGCWMFAVGQVDEEIPLPDWPVVSKGSEGYTSIMEIEVPAWADLKHVDARD